MKAYIVKGGVIGEQLASIKVSRDLYDRDYIEFQEREKEGSYLRLGDHNAAPPVPPETINIHYIPVIDMVCGVGEWWSPRIRILAFESKEQHAKVWY